MPNNFKLLISFRLFYNNDIFYLCIRKNEYFDKVKIYFKVFLTENKNGIIVNLKLRAFFDGLRYIKCFLKYR